ncbi:SLC13 family permease [Novosphingobium resinovorum]|uniref:SLC13 family permease n=1 Tax=Novosphingobium resinovorum TaxID=158500 RepID=UPI00361857BD
MTTLIGTPTNLILSSVREARLGTPFGFFTMTPVGVAVTVVGLVYLCVVGWRLLPVRTRSSSDGKPPWRVYELSVLDERLDAEELRSRLRAAGARMLASFRDIAPIAGIEYFQAGDRLLVVSRKNQWSVAATTGLASDVPADHVPDAVTVRVAVAHGSPLIGLGYDEVRTRSRSSCRSSR